MVELDTAQMVIGIEAMGFITHRQAVTYLVHWHRRDFHALAHPITSSLESIAIGTFVAVFVKTIAIGYAVFYCSSRQTVDKIKTIITVLPGSAIFKNVSLAVRTDMATESITISAIVYRDIYGVKVVVGVAVADGVMSRKTGKIESDSHAVVGCDMIKFAVTSPVNTDVF